MKKEDKQKEISELHEKFNTATVAILAEYKGLNVAEITELRHQLHSVDAELRVVKNTLAIRAAEGTQLVDARSSFEGPVAVALGYADPVAPTKVVKEFSDKKEQLKIKLGVIEGRVMDAPKLKVVAQLPKREVLLAHLVGQLEAPFRGVVLCLEGILRDFILTVEAVKAKKATTNQ
jgi:large subunit ribosomal protein L7/L12